MHIQRALKRLTAGSLLCAAVFAVAGSVIAQDDVQSMVTDPRMVVIPSRTAAEITNDIDNSQANKALALDRKAQAENRLKQVDGTIDSRKTALKDVDRRKGDAKKAKKDSELIALEIEKKAGQQAIELLNKLKDLRKTEIDEAQIEADLADIEVKVLGLENELLRKRGEYDSLASTGAGDLTLTTSQQVLRELEVRLLKLQQEQANMTQKLASKQKDLITRRMKLHEAQLKLGMPRA